MVRPAVVVAAGPKRGQLGQGGSGLLQQGCSSTQLRIASSNAAPSNTNSIARSLRDPARTPTSLSDLTVMLPTPEHSHSHRRVSTSTSPSTPSSASSSSLLSPRAASCSHSSTSSTMEYPHSLVTYSSFRTFHVLFDLPLTLLILLSFMLLSAFGWPSNSSGRQARFHLPQLALGTITWIASEAIRKRTFRYFASASNAILRSTAFLLLIHTFIQESLRLFAISLSLHQHLDGPSILVAASSEAQDRPPAGFFTIFDLALGFAEAETIWRTCELLGMLKLYEGAPKT